MSARPERTKSGETSINVVKSVLDSADYVADGMGFPEPSSVVERVAPATVAEAAGVPTLDDLSDDVLADLDEKFDIAYPPER